MRTTSAAALPLLVAALSASPALAAPELRVVDPCRDSEGEYSGLEATGFRPGARLQLVVDGEVLGNPVADADGAFSWNLRIGPAAGFSDAPRIADVAIEARDPADPAQSAFATQRMATVAVSATPSRGPAGTVARWRATGLAPRVAAGGHGRVVYAHWLRNGRYVATTRFGWMRGPCGNIRQRHPLVPAAIARPGSWEVRLVNRRAFDPDRGGYAATTITVTGRG